MTPLYLRTEVFPSAAGLLPGGFCIVGTSPTLTSYFIFLRLI